MPVSAGYSLPIPDGTTTYEEVLDGFEWDVPETFNLGTVVETNDDTPPETTALVHVDDAGETHRFTYGELEAAASALAAHLSDAGLESGDRIALCFPQSPELLVAHLATYRIGCLAVPLSVILGEESLSYTLEHSDATALLADARVSERFESTLTEYDFGYELAVELGGVDVEAETEVETETAGGERYTGSDRHLGGYAGYVASDGEQEVVQTAPEDPAIIVYTSGTSGKPKGVVQTHQYVIGALPSYQCWFHCFESTHRERVWTPAEWSWAGALFDVVFPTLALGGTVVSRVRRSGFDPERALELLERQRVSRAFMPPTALWQIRQHADPSAHELDALEVLMCGGEKLSAPLSRWAERELDVVVNESYGQTEANALIGNCRVLFEPREDSMGKPYPGHECRIVDEEYRPVKPGEVGQIALALPDPVLFDGYWNDEAATEECFADGLYLTGDLATRDEDGYVHFAGRADDLIITAGYRVSPAEVESALCTAPGVTEAAVGGVPDEERGQRIKAYVLLESGERADGVDEDGNTDESTADALRQHVREQLGAHKAPREVVVLEEPPQTRTGKLDRSALFSD
ncbi:AMP-binding protein [Halobacteria archaeon AArc-m2/3/4]|uniref:AMP-binding protein n=1 Tax=Natronoglomus mannanivorans TaxID=2979990 RepID=A0ABT2QGM5_9EURY|nr:AMP-binding protein [Halobacteria archaeon AArc-m2/3/4]